MTKTIFHPADYGESAYLSSYWAKGENHLDFPPPNQREFDIAIIGSGYTGLSAALKLAQAGLNVIVIEAGNIGVGCSSRNGGFVCAGGTWLSDEALDRRYGENASAEYWEFANQAVELVQKRAEIWKIKMHGDGEYCAIHSNKSRETLKANQGKDALITNKALPDLGYGFICHSGFAINPRHYAEALTQASAQSGVSFQSHTEVKQIHQNGVKFTLHTTRGDFSASKVIVATNGYHRNGLHPALNRVVFPVRSNVITTEPIEGSDFDALSWHSLSPIYDSRKLLHYYRRLPDDRVLFGMRGGFQYAPANLGEIAKRNKADFDQMFPSLAHYKSEDSWFGLIAMTARQHPFIGEIDEGIYAAFGYHGNGVAMGSLAGEEIARQILGQKPNAPGFLSTKPWRFPPALIMRGITRMVAAAYRFQDGREK